MTVVPLNKTQAFYRRVKERIPGGTQLLSKRPEMFLPDQWPGYYKRAKGVEVWDLDNKRYVDMTSTAIGACLLGFADDDVNAAAKRAIDDGSMTTLNCPEELELAELLCEIHPWADMVRYARSGGEAIAIAVRIARAASGKDVVAFCGYHGWHDWYLAANLASDSSLDGHLLPGLEPAGVPRCLVGTSLPFAYNRTDELDAIVKTRSGEIGVIVMEPLRYADPAPGFLEHVRDVANKLGAVLIFDEITSGWRFRSGGVHLSYGVEPDVAVFAKAMGNGFPIAAIIGRCNVMQAAQRTFISSTNWTERVGPAAALATIRKLRRTDAVAKIAQTGTSMQAGWSALGKKHGLNIHIEGKPALGHFAFKDGDGPLLGSLFTQEMLARGYLATTSFYATAAHTAAHVEAYLQAADDVFGRIVAALDDGNAAAMLRGPVAHAGFKRLT